MTLNPKSNRAAPKGGDGKTTVVFVSETITTGSIKSAHPDDASSVQDEIHHRADTVTEVLSKIMDQPDVSYRWGLND